MFGQRTDMAPMAPMGVRQKLVENDPNWIVMLQLWWSLVWRSLLWTILFMIIAIIVSIVLSFVLAFIMGLDKETTSSIGSIFGFIGGIVASLFAFFKSFKGLLGKRFSGYQLVLLTPEMAQETEKSGL